MNENYRVNKKIKDAKPGTLRSSYDEEDRNRVSTESPDSYDLSISMETKILSSGSSSKDRDKLVPKFRQSYARHPSQYQTETQMGSGVCLINIQIAALLLLCTLKS